MKSVRFALFLFLLALVGVLLCFFGIWIPNSPSPTAYPVRGIDVSHHQGDIDWTKVKEVSFVYMKATEGERDKDPEFSDNWEGARKAGIVRGAYHFYTFDVPARRQADNFHDTVPLLNDALPPAIDLEFSGANATVRPPANEFQAEFVVFLGIMKAYYAKEPVVYTTPDFAAQYLQGVPLKRLWIREILTRPKTNDWTLWQFSERGRVPGIPGYADLDVFKGDRAAFEGWLKATP